MVKVKQSNYLQSQNYVAKGGFISTVFVLCVHTLTVNLCVLASN